ncbi:aldehyde dehydrogenase (NADP(+)) [Nocardioides zeae]|uniref:Aldehyde dehydrogenase (NADP(+)) n=1 Tax=Nocardioides imazamoxiresistens TaxID=3231893 RepID=A0ABU3PSB4_9ACTN|nr:aldehyde dehydrogenase (NADP(+)) [Nocardioides zeae]MDT9592093.1 aldehyde dehydrogenase (NADP(+)) [Nocardioides zeae]
MTQPQAASGLTGEMFLGERRVLGTEGTVRAVDPRTGEEVGVEYGLGSAAEVDIAATLAAQAHPVYRATGPEERAAFLERVADNIAALGDTLVAQVLLESGLPEPRVRGEIGRTTGQLRLFASVVRDGSFHGARIETALPERTPLPRPDVRQRKVPVGPVAVFGASNFPLAFSVAGGDTASALAAGCPVVVKAHEAHPGTSELVGGAIASAVAESGLPQGVFSMVYGEGPVVGSALAAHPAIKAVGFTGSRRAGVALMQVAAAREVPIPVYAEMSSINPVFLLPGALAEDAAGIADGYVASLTTGAGQLCTSPGLVLAVAGEGLDTFLERVGEQLPGCAAQTMLTPGIHSAYEAGVERLVNADGVRVVGRGATPAEGAPTEGQALVVTVPAETFVANPALGEENFGSSSVVVVADDTSALVRVAQEIEGQLTATLQATGADHEAAAALLPVLEDKVGRILFNGWPTGVDVGQAMVHGGPFPATSDGRSTSVGTLAIERFLRPVAYQNVPADLLPAPVADANPLGIWRQVEGDLTRD